MYSHEYSIIADLPPDQVWKAWSDVSNWNKWDHDIEWSVLSGEFKNGGKITLKPRNSSEVHGVIENCEPLRSFTNATPIKFFELTLATLRFYHFLQERNSQVKIVNRIEITGPCAFIFWQLIGKSIARGFAKQLESLVCYVGSATFKK